jgi:CHAT domain-containing protein
MTSTASEHNEFSILHISAHMTMDQHAPLFSAIQLDPDDQHDGSLTVHELYSLLSEESSMDLVVLSGCDTGRGGTSGEDYALLVRSFISSGAEGVIASLWSVDDRATSELLTLFYQYLKSGDSESKALQKAMLEVRVQFPDPYYWAAFAYTGRP